MRWRWVGDILAVASAVCLVVGFVGFLAWQWAYPQSVPALLKSNWYLLAFLGFVPFEALWLWMLADAVRTLARTRSRDALVWLVVLFLVNITVWPYYFVRYRLRHGALA